MLLFIVLFYVYPLKFLFALLVNQLLGYDTAVDPSSGAVVEEIEPGQLPLLMVIYGAGFIAVQLVFFILYLRAYALRSALGLDPHEVSNKRGDLRLPAGDRSRAHFDRDRRPRGEEAASLAGGTYLLLFPLLTVNGYLMGRRRRKSS